MKKIWMRGNLMRTFLRFRSASVHINKVNFGNDDHFDSLLYRISVTNSEVLSDSNVTLEQMELAGNLDSGQRFLNFHDEVGPPRYLVVSGSDVSAFKHRMPEWDKPGSFTIKAKTITPVLSENNDISLASAFGLTVEMGGERFYEGTIFETNIINADVEPAVFSSPWDPAASFVINNSSGQNTQVKAHIPRRLLSGMYGIMNPNDVKSAIINQEGNLTYLSHQFIPTEDSNLIITKLFIPPMMIRSIFWMTMNLVYKKSFPRVPRNLR